MPLQTYIIQINSRWGMRTYKVILINVQKILNKYVHMLSYMSCIEGAHYDNRIQCNHRFTYTVC